MRRTAAAWALAVALVAGAAPTASAGERYVALGDSYSSGTGTRDYDLSERCERSRRAYPALVAARRPALDLVFAACGGATTGDVLDGQISRLDDATRWVTITIGGNDIGFSAAIRKCGEPRSASACRIRVRRAQHRIREHLPGQLDAVYRAIRGRAPRATVVVLGYPRLFGREDCNAATFYSRSELIQLNHTADLLRDMLRERVGAAGPGFVFRDAIGAFEGHAVCARDEWLNGLSDPTGESFHPNRDGHRRGYAPLVLDVLGQPPPPPAAGPPAPPGPQPPGPQPGVPDRIANDTRLNASRNDFLLSADGRYRFVMQSDGNLVLYGPSGRALWASNTQGRPADHVRMQGEGNLVVYDAGERPLWNSGTPGHANSQLIVQNDGNVVIYSGGRPTWATGTDGRT